VAREVYTKGVRRAVLANSAEETEKREIESEEMCWQKRGRGGKKQKKKKSQAWRGGGMRIDV
jgi:hypothetical protein